MNTYKKSSIVFTLSILMGCVDPSITGLLDHVVENFSPRENIDQQEVYEEPQVIIEVPSNKSTVENTDKSPSTASSITSNSNVENAEPILEKTTNSNASETEVIHESSGKNLNTDNFSTENGNRPKPSFNCEMASTAIENMICSSFELAKLDSQLSKEYKASKIRTLNKSLLLTSQRKWLKEERNNCSSIECLILVYRNRINILIAYN